MDLLQRVQRESAHWRRVNFPAYTADQQFKGMVEEMGELAHATLKHEQGIRGLESEVVAREKIADAWADWLIFSFGFLDEYGMDAHNILETTWERVKLRDFRKDPQKGGEV